MKRVLLMMTAAAVVMAGCRKEPCQKCIESQNAIASLVVDIQGLPMSVTKEENGSGYENRIVLMDIAIYDADGILEWARHCEVLPSSRQSVTGLKAGKKSVCAVANLSMEAMPGTLEGFYKMATDLGDNGRNGFVMAGTVEGEASPDPDPVILRLSRVAAKFSVDGNISVDWADDAPGSFRITDIYLANVSVTSNAGYESSLPSVNLRTDSTPTSDTIYRALTVASGTSRSSGAPFGGEITFYGYPNTDQNRTCIMIKALYDGRICYYPLVIDREIRSNTWYRVGNVTITCEGVKNPWDDFTREKGYFELTVADWDYNEYPEISF